MPNHQTNRPGNRRRRIPVPANAPLVPTFCEQYPDSAECYYHLACYLSRGGLRDEALEQVMEATARDALLGPRARLDTDLEPLWRDPAFLSVTGE